MRFLTALLFAIVLVTFSALGQSVRIQSNDIPAAGDTFRMSIANNPQVLNLQKTGADQTWDYTSLVSNGAQYVDTYYAMSEVPTTYQLLTFLKGANLGYLNLSANPGNQLDSLTGSLPVENLFAFYRKNSQSYSQVAYGVTLTFAGIPAPFDQNDVIYDFPLAYGNQDSSNASFTFPPSNLPSPDSLDFYFERSQKRVNEVDGYGTLKTPYGSFQTVRVKSKVFYDDSIYFQGQGQDIPPYQVTEYKWLGKNQGAPLLRARTIGGGEGLPVSFVTYQDSVRNVATNPDTGEDSTSRVELLEGAKSSSPSIFPNPTKGKVHVKLPAKWADQSIRMQIIDINGQAVEAKLMKNQVRQQNGKTTFNFNHLDPGYYLVAFQQGGNLLDVQELVLEE